MNNVKQLSGTVQTSSLLYIFIVTYMAVFNSILQASIKIETNAAPSRKSWASNWVIKSETGRFHTVHKNDTAEIVTIELTKK